MSAVVFSLRATCPVDRLQWLSRCRPVTSQLTIGDVIICRCVRVCMWHWPIHVHARLHNYLRQGGHVLVVDCLSACLFVSLLATLRKNFRTDLHEISREGWQWANELTIKFW